eukprot:COSAG06_NODE_8393_length_2187_cov_34.717912_1_plen_94_part_00
MIEDEDREARQVQMAVPTLDAIIEPIDKATKPTAAELLWGANTVDGQAARMISVRGWNRRRHRESDDGGGYLGSGAACHAVPHIPRLSRWQRR